MMGKPEVTRSSCFSAARLPQIARANRCVRCERDDFFLPPFYNGDFTSSIPSISKQYHPLGYSWSLLCLPSDRTLVCFRTRFDYFAKASPDCHATLVLCDLPLERGLFLEFQSILLLLCNRNVSIASRFL